MNITIIKQRLRAAKREWENSQRSPDVIGLPGFLQGVIQGFKEALVIIQHYHREELRKSRMQRRPLSRWNGMILYKACTQAYQRLKHSDRASAMRILQRAVGKVSKSERAHRNHPTRVVESGDIPPSSG